jgi:hypothetical protein
MAVDELVGAIGTKFQISGERLAALDLDAILDRKLNVNAANSEHVTEKASRHSSISDAETISAEQTSPSVISNR